MECGRERTLARHVLIEMTDVGGEHDKASARPDADELQTGRMSARRMDGQSGSNLGVPIVEKYPAGIVQPHDAADILDLERMRQPWILHIASGRVGKFALLKVKSRIRESIEIAGMIVMQMRQDHIL